MLSYLITLGSHYAGISYLIAKTSKCYVHFTWISCFALFTSNISKMSSLHLQSSHCAFYKICITFLVSWSTVRSFQNYVSNSDADGLSKLGMQGMSPELVKTASEMIGTMKPEELQKMFQAASSLTGTNPVGSNLGPNMPEMSPDMVNMASEMIGKMSPAELQNMMDFASKMGGPGSAPVRPGTGSNIRPSSRAETSSNNFQPSSSQTVVENPDEIVNNQSMDHSSSSSPVSTADMQETMRNSMKDPAMRQVKIF